MKLEKIPEKIKYLVFGISILIFFAFYFEIVRIESFLQNIGEYYFINYFNNLDYLIFASIPIFGMLINSNRNKFEILKLFIDILKILFCVITVSGIGIYFLSIIGKNSNPFIPEYFITEPFSLFSVLTIGIGIGIPFILINRNEKQNEINEIGKKN